MQQKTSRESKHAIKQYLKEVQKKLTCPLSVKSVFLGELKSNLLEYAEGKENITAEALCANFGDPKEIVDGFLERSDYQELLKKAKKKLQLWRVFSAVLAVLIVLTILYLIKVCYDLSGTMHYT